MTCSAMPFVRGFLFFLRFFLRGVLDCSLEDEESVDPDAALREEVSFRNFCSVFVFFLLVITHGTQEKMYSYIT